MLRRLLVPVLLVVVAVGAAMQAQRADDAADPGQAPEAGPLDASVTTPILSVRRTPEWLRQPLADSLLESEVRSASATGATPDQTCIVAHRDGDAIAEIQQDVLFVPASAQKLLTAAAILELAPPTETFRTEVVTLVDAVIVEPELEEGEEDPGNTLEGDIWLIGGGDPVLSTPEYIGRYDEPRPYTDFTLLADQVAASLTEDGITTVTGGIIADEVKYPGNPPERDYVDEPPVIRTEVNEEGETVEVEVPIWKESFRTENQVGPLSALLLNDGYTSWPEDPALRIENTRADDPAVAAGEVLRLLLEERGIIVQGPTTNAIAPPLSDRDSLGVVESPPLSEIVGRMLTHSDNTTAEMLLKEIGVRSGFGASRGFAVNGMLRVMRDAGYPMSDVVIADGSGLSSLNQVRCSLLVEILDRAEPDSALVQGLAVVGQSGTLRECLEAQPQFGDVLAKTGTLNDVTALSGLTVADNGDVVTFSMIANGTGVGIELGPCNILQTTLIRAVSGHPYGPDLTDLGPLGGDGAEGSGTEAATDGSAGG